MSERQNKPGGAPRGNKNAIIHGVYSYRAMLNGGRLDERSSLFRALKEKEAELTAALGGDVSPQQQALINDTVKTMLYLGSLDCYLSALKSLVRKGRVHGVLSERTRLAAHMRENLRTLGLSRMAKEPTLDDLLSAPDQSSPSTNENGRETTQRSEARAEQPRNDNGTFSGNGRSEQGDVE